MHPLISVIIPVYGVEPYLKRCISSVINQTYDNLEIILIDDESPDNCGIICDEYEKADSRVKVIHQKNKGLSGARNSGINIANGKYITFVDSDDLLEKDAVMLMYLFAESSKAGIVQIGDVSFQSLSEIDSSAENTSYDISSHSFREYDTPDDFLIEVNQRKNGGSAWGKLFSAELIGNSRFDEGILNEDYLFYSKLLIGEKIKMVLIDDYRGYYYFIRDNSITHSGVGKSVIDAVSNTKFAKKLAEEKCPALVPYIGAYVAYQSTIVIIGVNKDNPLYSKQLIKDCKGNIIENKRYLNLFPGGLNVKLFCYFAMLLPQPVTEALAKIRYGLKK